MLRLYRDEIFYRRGAVVAYARWALFFGQPKRFSALQTALLSRY
jgi:hypothetical protein